MPFSISLSDGRHRQDLVGLRQDLAGLGVDDVVHQHLALQILDRHGQLLDAGLLEIAHVAGGDAPALLDDDLLADADLEGGRLAAQALRDDLERDLLLRQMEHVLLEEHVENLLLGVAQGAQNDGHRELAAPVDAREHAVLRVELEVEPGAAIRNDARGEQKLAGGVRLAAVVIEEHAGAAMQLRDDDSLGAVDDERAVLGHERQFAEVDLLFAHVLHGLLRTARFLVEHHEPNLDAQRRRIGEAAQLAFLDVEHRLAEPIAHVLERRVAGVAGDREYAIEGRVQADLVTTRLRRIRLQESPVGIELNRQQVWRAEDARTLAKVLADALLFGERIGHVRDSPVQLAPSAPISTWRRCVPVR